MDIPKLDKANDLYRKIREFEEALNCFNWGEEYGGDSTNPRLIIEFDRDGREQNPLPMNLSNELVKFLKEEIMKGRDIAVSEFIAL